ncbi:MAG: citrate lyase subunit alpha [Eisenbergiella sp.]
MGGKSNCTSSYSMVDANMDHVVVVTDCLVEYPNLPASISQVDVDYVVEVEAIGNPDKIVSNVVRMTNDVRELKMAEYCARVIAKAPFFKDGFSFQTGGGGAALAVNRMLRPYLEEKNIRMGFAIGRITRPMCERALCAGLWMPSADAASVKSVENDPGHLKYPPPNTLTR